MPVDPFRSDAGCGGPSVDTLWINAPTYQPGGLLVAGLSITLPDYDAVKVGTAALEVIAADAPLLVACGYGYGARQGDVLRLGIIGLGGETVFQQDTLLDKEQAQYFRAAGRHARAP